MHRRRHGRCVPVSVDGQRKERTDPESAGLM